MPTATVEDVETALDVMFWGVLYLTLAVLPQMRVRRSGRVRNITSIGGMVSVPHLLSYNCAKFAAIDLSEGLRTELGQEGIRVTTLVPGLMRTGSYLCGIPGTARTRIYLVCPGCQSAADLHECEACSAADRMGDTAWRG